MNEELNIKIKVDTSAITPAVNKLKNEVSNVNKQVKTSLSGATSSSSDKQVKSTEKLSKALDKIEKVVNNIKGGISGWDITKTVVGIKGIEYAFNGAKKSVKELGNIIGNTFDGHLFNAISFSLKGETDSAKIELEEFKYVVKGRMKQIKESLGGAFSNLKNGDVKKSLTSLKIALTGGADVGKTFGAIMKSIGVILTSVATIVGTLTVALAGLVGVMGVVAAFKISKLGNEVYHTAQQFGFSTKAFQEWSYIMERNGSSIEDLKGFLETLNSEQGAVITGSEEAAQKFRNLGISAEEAANMDSQTLFETTIAKLQGIEDATLRSSYAYEMFGDEASRLMNVINMSNAEMGAAVNQYHLLGGAMSGELIESSNSLQGSIAGMRQAWQGVANTLAAVFIPVVQAVVNWITKAIVIVNLFLRTIFGLDLKTKSASTNVDKATTSNKKYAGSIGAAKKAIEEFKRSVMGFDELNIVSSPKSSGSSGGGVGSIDTPDIPTFDDSILNVDDLDLEKIYEWFEEYKDLIKQIVVWSLIGTGVLLAVIGGLQGNIGLIALGLGLAGMGIFLGFKSGVWDEQINKVKKAWEDLCIWFQDNVAPVFTKEFWAKLWDSIKIITAEKLNEISQSLSEAWEKLKKWFIQEILPQFTEEYWVNLWNNIKIVASEKFSEISQSINQGWNTVKTWYATNIRPYFTFSFWKGVFNSINQGIIDAFIGANNFIKNGWKGIKRWYNDNIKEKFTLRYWGEIFNSIPQGMRGAINSAIEAVERGINYIVRKVNTISFKIPDWVPKIGGNKFGFNLREVSVPRLAEGGIATRSVLANIGEAGKEAVLPLEYNTEWMDTLADKIAARNGGPTKVVLQVNDKELGWATIDSINSITKQTGAIQLTL